MFVAAPDTADRVDRRGFRFDGYEPLSEEEQRLFDAADAEEDAEDESRVRRTRERERERERKRKRRFDLFAFCSCQLVEDEELFQHAEQHVKQPASAVQVRD